MESFSKKYIIISWRYITPDIFYILYFIFLMSKKDLFGCFVCLLEIWWTFFSCRHASRVKSQGNIQLLKKSNCNGGEQTVRVQLPV